MGIAEDIGRLETELRELIIKYEQYFCGIEKREPLRKLELVDRLVKRYQNVSIPNTMHRFKYESLVSTLSVHRQKWTRINRLIEEGKYERDRFKMALHRTEPAGDQPDQPSGDQPTPPAPPNQPGQPSQAAQSSQSARPAPLASDPQLQRLYQEYCSARRACNLPVDNVSLEKIASAIEQRMPIIKEKYRCAEAEFFVVVENGRPCLKARQKKC